MTVTAAGGSHQTAAQRGGELRDKDRPLPDVQRDRRAPAPCLPPDQGARFCARGHSLLGGDEGDRIRPSTRVTVCARVATVRTAARPAPQAAHVQDTHRALVSCQHGQARFGPGILLVIFEVTRGSDLAYMIRRQARLSTFYVLLPAFRVLPLLKRSACAWMVLLRVQ